MTTNSNSNIEEQAYKTFMRDIEKLIDGKIEERKKKQVSVRPSIAYKALGNKMYLCPIDGYEYKVWNVLGIDLKPCQKVWILIPHGRVEDKFICGLRK